MKKKRHRTAFGRVERAIEGSIYNFEHRQDGIYIRRRYGRNWLRISHGDLLDFAVGQFKLPTNNQQPTIN